MITGTPNTVKIAEEQSKIISLITGQKRFALLPTKLKDGTYVWLSYYYAFYFGGVHSDGTYFLWSASPDSYSPYYAAYLDEDISHINCTCSAV